VIRHVPAAAAYSQLVAAGAAAHLCATSLLAGRDEPTDRRTPWLTAFAGSIAAVLCANVWVFVASVSTARWAIEARSVTELAALITLLGTAAVVVGRRPPWTWMAVFAALTVTRAVLLPETHLIISGFRANGVEIYGPLGQVLGAPVVVGSVGLAAWSAHRSGDRIVRWAFGLPLLGCALVAGTAWVVLRGPWTELVAAYWLLPTLVGLHALELREKRGAAEAVQRHSETTRELAALRQRSDLALRSGDMTWWEYEETTGATWLSPELARRIESPEYAWMPELIAGLPPDAGETVTRLLHDALESGAATAEYPVERLDGSIHWIEATAMRASDGGARRVLAVERDVTDKRIAAEQLRHQATHDALTGLPNRLALTERIQDALSAGRQLSLLVLDLDHFKDINDSLGHQVGDIVVREAAARLVSVLPEGTGVARLGGDEFAIVHEDDRRGSGPELAQRILDAFEMPFGVAGVSISIRASIGVVHAPDDGGDVTTLLRRADAAMYAAKGRGGRWQVYSGDDAGGSRRLRLAGELPDALRTSQIQVYYQPTVSLSTHRVRTSEALVRWHHPVHGVVLPNEFVPLAEAYGLGLALTARVLGDALEQCARWRQETLAQCVAINVSAHALCDAELPRIVTTALGRAGLPPDALVLELTEEAFAANSPELRGAIGGLRELGVRIAIDDYGAGYSSLSYLGRLEIDTIKLDREFTMQLDTDPKAQAIVESTIELAHRLGLVVVAEGVETKSTVDELLRYGCDVAQGYYFCRPQQAEAAIEWLRFWAGRTGGTASPLDRLNSTLTSTLAREPSEKRAPAR